MKVYSLHIYPVKSLAGIQVSSFEMDDFGPKGDRRWMIIDEDRRFVTQRALPELARVTTSVGADGVGVHIPGEGDFTLQVTDHELRVLVWRDWVKACEGVAATNEALSRFCGKDLRFVHMPDTSFLCRCRACNRIPSRWVCRRISFFYYQPCLSGGLEWSAWMHQ